MKTVVKIILFLALVVCAIEFTTKGESKAFGGILVKMGIVKAGDSRTIKDRIESKMDGARDNERRRLEHVEETSELHR